MNKLLILLNLVSGEKLQVIIDDCKKQDNLVSRLILLTVKNRNWPDKKIISSLGISGNTFNKICTQAKDYLITTLQKNTETPFDGIYVIQKLIFAGELDLAQKLLNDQEKSLEQKQLWLQLEVLYVEASRIYYTNGNLPASLKLAEKRNANSIRLGKYINLNSKIVNEMIRLEGFKNRKPDLKKYHATILKLKEDAFRINHHVLIHNALHLNYMFASRYFQKAKLVHEIILDMQANEKKFDNVLNSLSKAIIKNTHLNFLTIYNGFGNPEEFINEVKKSIGDAGKIAHANMCYAMLEYYLYQGNIPKVMGLLDELQLIEDNSKFRQFKHIIFAIKSFIEGDFDLFKKHLSAFYSDASHLDFPDMEINLRIIELLLLWNYKNEYLLESKISSLKKYMSRNVNKERYHDERKIVVLIEKNIYNSSIMKSSALDQLANSNYRSIVFLTESMKRIHVKKSS
jgi:hypothetical protein